MGSERRLVLEVHTTESKEFRILGAFVKFRNRLLV